MRYTYFEVRNFKGIQRARLQFDAAPPSRIYALIGLNESGKTTLLEAISSFTYGAQEVVDDLTGVAARDPHRLIPVARRSNFTDSVVLEVGIKADDSDIAALTEHMRQSHPGIELEISDDRVFRITESTIFRNSRFVEKTTSWQLSINARLAGQRKFRTYSTKSGNDIWNAAALFLMKRLPHIRFFPNFLFEFPDRLYLEPNSQSPKEQFYRSLLGTIVESVGVGANVDEHILQRANSREIEDKQSLDGLLLQVGRSLTKRVFGAWNEIFNRQIRDKSVVITLARDETERPYLRLQIQDADGYFALSERSLGFRWFFVYLLLTSYGAGSGSGVLYLLDEPASNLHSTAQAQLLRSFADLAIDNWLVYTTHSHHMVNPAWLESTFIVRNAGVDVDDDEDYTAALTDITLSRYREFVAQHPDQSRYFQPVLDVLDYQPSRLEFVPRAVLVEGKNDYYTLRYFQDVLALTPRIHLMPGGGAGSLDTVIRLYLGWGRDFIVLLDSDEEGVKQVRRYMDVFGAVLGGRLFTLSDIRPAWSGYSLEQLIEEADRQTIQRAVNPLASTVDKKTFNRSIQELLLLGQSVAVGQNTVRNMEAVHGFISSRLNAL